VSKPACIDPCAPVTARRDRAAALWHGRVVADTAPAGGPEPEPD